MVPTAYAPAAYYIVPPPLIAQYDNTIPRTSTQIGLQRLQDAGADSYIPGTLPPWLYQTNPFAVRPIDTEIGEDCYVLSGQEQPASAKEVEDALEEQGMSNAIQALFLTSRAGRTLKPTEKARAGRAA